MKTSMIKNRLIKSCLTGLVASLVATAAFAQDAPKAQTLEQLLEMVKQNKILESRDHQNREAEFRKDKAQQQAALQRAKELKAAEERRSVTLERRYEEQQKLVEERRVQLQARLGSLDELFGHLTSQAGDTRVVLEGSLVSVQPGLDNRAKFLDDLIEKMNGATQIPELAEIEQLWFEMQREAVEGGKIVSFAAPVKRLNGETSNETVIRIGNYNLIDTNGNYLYKTDANEIAELPRQPAGFTSAAAELAVATGGFVRVGIDPTGAQGGVFLRAIINMPNFLERVDQGGAIGYAIMALGAFGLLLASVRLLMMAAIGSKVSAQLRAKKANPNNPLGRVLQVAEDNVGIDTESLELKLEEAILKERPSIESGLNLLKVIYMIAPLMGLLGTVGGMIQTFQAITIYGTGDPSTMAEGISAALVTTMQGLLVAIPVMLLHTIVSGRAKRILHILDEQSAGLVAQNSERK